MWEPSGSGHKLGTCHDSTRTKPRNSPIQKPQPRTICRGKGGSLLQRCGMGKRGQRPLLLMLRSQVTECVAPLGGRDPSHPGSGWGDDSLCPGPGFGLERVQMSLIHSPSRCLRTPPIQQLLFPGSGRQSWGAQGIPPASPLLRPRLPTALAKP